MSKQNKLYGKVAALWTRPETVIEDIERLTELVGYTILGKFQ